MRACTVPLSLKKPNILLVSALLLHIGDILPQKYVLSMFFADILAKVRRKCIYTPGA